ncbi:MAG: arginine N-succinyltransferase [Proteobacteria bacterium]|nr:arginine N-succinyltransferase [Pseudomonadota bacterium]MBU1059031.1 arginine N-succinyltransferase [Pseudomonadota bacterium]
MEHSEKSGSEESKKGFSGLQVFAIVAGTISVTIIVTLLAARVYLFPKPFEPVVLTGVEQQQLDQKLDQFESMGMTADHHSQPRPSKGPGKHEEDFEADGRLTPQKYSEEGASRDVVFSEREINALIATNTDMADKLAIDLSDDLISAKMRVPVDPDFPMFGGKTLRLRAGVEMAYRDGQPVVKIKGVSLMGMPIPNAWLGGMKNIDLVKEFSGDDGFWKAFGDGVESIRVEEGTLKVSLKE